MLRQLFQSVAISGLIIFQNLIQLFLWFPELSVHVVNG